MYTEYEASQIQRGIERKIRRWKHENIAMEAAGEDISESAAYVNIQTNTIRTAFSKDEFDDKTIRMMEVIKKL